MTKQPVTVEPIYKSNREPRPGELNYELRRIIVKHCARLPIRDAIKSVEIAVNRLARKMGLQEVVVDYDRSSDTRNGRPWVCDGISVRVYRRRSNGTLAIHRVGVSSSPHFFPGPDGRYANLSAPRDINVFYGIDDPYDWEHHTCKKPRRSLVEKWKRQGMKRIPK